MSEDVYRQLQKHFDGFPMSFPETESGVEIRLLKILFTSDEAEIASRIRFSPWDSFESFDSVETIFERVKHLSHSKDEIVKLLDNMAKKGVIMGVTHNNKKVYANTLFIIGIFEHQVNKLSKEFVAEMMQYIKEAWSSEAGKIGVPQLRTIPVGITIDHENPISKYDDIKILFDKSEGPFSIINCVCRQKQDLKNKPCQVTDRREVCLAIGNFARLYNEQNWGREITKDEALEYLKQNEQDGLIFQPGNTQKIDFVCSCCACCCLGLGGLKRIPNPADYVTSNYYAEVNQDLCTGCGNCVERCQMDAITLEDELASVNIKRCIGCGNCILDCPENAISMVAKEQIEIPPETLSKLYDQMTEKRKTI